MALGAGRRGVIAMVMRGAVIQTLLGLGIGIPIALLSVRFVKSQLYEITSAICRDACGNRNAVNCSVRRGAHSQRGGSFD